MASMKNAWSPAAIRAKKSHPLEWLLEPLEDHPGYMRRSMFGGQSIYLNGRLSIHITAGEEPWNGLLVVTYREFHPALIKQWPALKSHEILGKWLYLSQNHASFETVASAIVRSIRAGDPRIGIDPKPPKKVRRTKKVKKKA